MQHGSQARLFYMSKYNHQIAMSAVDINPTMDKMSWMKKELSIFQSHRFVYITEIRPVDGWMDGWCVHKKK